MLVTFCLRSDAWFADFVLSLDIDASAFLRSLFSFCFAFCFLSFSILALYSVRTLHAQRRTHQIGSGLRAGSLQARSKPRQQGRHSLSLVHAIEAPGAGCQLLIFMLAEPPHNHAQALLPWENNLGHIDIVPLFHQRIQNVARLC